MVEYEIVAESNSRPSSTTPVGAFASLVKGFERVAAAPLLLLPSLVLDMLLWLGPHLKISSLARWAVEAITIPSNATVELYDQIRLLRLGLLEIGERFNLLTALSSLPIGVPSLMSARMPSDTPVGMPILIEITEPSYVIAIWLVLTVFGLGLGGAYHLWIAHQAAPGKKLIKSWKMWLRILALAGVAYVTIVAYLFVSVFAATLAASLLPFLGVLILFLSFTLLFWLVVYLIFTPHGIVRYDMGLLQALMESAAVVRWNLVGTLAFLGMAFVVGWLTSQVWLLPPEISWFSLLALLGHAFVSAVLWLGSYIYYQGRREWLLAHREKLSLRRVSSDSPEIM